MLHYKILCLIVMDLVHTPVHLANTLLRDLRIGRTLNLCGHYTNTYELTL